jgi:hypothetical protein
MGDIEIKVTGKALRMFNKGGPAMRATTRATKRAGSTSARDMTNGAVKLVNRSKALKVATIKKSVSIKPNRARRIPDMRWGVKVRAKTLLVSDYPFRPVNKGVSVTINRGKRKLIRGAFVATLQSGHKGVFKRRGKARLPIFQPVATRAFDVLRKPSSIAALQELGNSSFRKTFLRNFSLEIAKL